MFFTQNPIGSSANEDLQDNAISFDYAMNSPAALWQDRFGKQHKTVQQALKDVGFKPAGFDFVGGGTLGIGDRDKCVFYPTDGYWYSWNGKLPYVVPANSSPTPGGKKGWGVVTRDERVVAREALRRTYLEVGLNLVEGSFEEGGTLNNQNDVLLQERTGKVFSGPAGAVAAGTDPTSGGFVDISSTPSRYRPRFVTDPEFGADPTYHPTINPTADSTSAFLAALDFKWVTYPGPSSLVYYPEAINKHVKVPLGSYLITDSLPLVSYLCLDFDDGVVLHFKPTAKKDLFVPPISAMQAAYAAGHASWKDMTLFGVDIKGAALLKGNMTGSSTVHAGWAINAANSHHGRFSRLMIEGFEGGLSINRMNTSAWTGGSRKGNFYENVVDNLSIQDCKRPFYNDGNLTTVIGGKIGHETLLKTDANMGDYLVEQRGAGFTAFNWNVASITRNHNPKVGHIFETCYGSTYHGIYSEYFDNLFVVDPIERWGGLSLDPGHIVKYPSDKLLKFVSGYMPSYDPATKTRGGKNLKSSANWTELLNSGIRIFKSEAELIEDFFEFAPFFDFKYGLYGTWLAWNQQIAVDFKRYELNSTGFLSPHGARFIATQASNFNIPVKNNQYDAYVCVLYRVISGTWESRNIKLNVRGANEFISVAEDVFDYGNGWKMAAVRNANIDPKVKTYLNIVFPTGVQVEIEHIGAYKNGVPLYPTVVDFTPRVNSDNFMFGGNSDVATSYLRVSGGQFKKGDIVGPFIPVLADGSLDETRPIKFRYVQVAGSNRQNALDGNHAGFYGAAPVTFIGGSTFDSNAICAGNSRNLSESVGIGQFIGVTFSSVLTNNALIVDREYDIPTAKYTTKLVVDKVIGDGAATVSHTTAIKPVLVDI